jgi:hypothetical protein
VEVKQRDIKYKKKLIDKFMRLRAATDDIMESKRMM